MLITETIAAGIAAIAIACGGLSAYAIHRAGRAQNEAIEGRLSALEEALAGLHAEGAAAKERLDRTGVRISNLQKRRSEDRTAADANLLAVRDALAERIDALSARIEAIEESSPSFSIVE